jgi:hypothetical protein
LPLQDEGKRRAAQEKKVQAAAEKEKVAWRQEMANVAKYVEEYEVALKKQALWEEKKRKAAKAKAAKMAKTKVAKGKDRCIEPISEDSGESDGDDTARGEESGVEITGK